VGEIQKPAFGQSSISHYDPQPVVAFSQIGIQPPVDCLCRAGVINIVYNGKQCENVGKIYQNFSLTLNLEEKA
jgi:hypothetical protein